MTQRPPSDKPLRSASITAGPNRAAARSYQRAAGLDDADFTRPYDRATIERTLATFYQRFFSQQFKRSCVPDGPKVGSVSLSPRGDWRMPSDANAAEWLRWAAERTNPNDIPSRPRVAKERRNRKTS